MDELPALLKTEPTQDNAPPLKVWGFIENGIFIELPRIPFKKASIEGPPPFVVTLPSGKERQIIEKPDDQN